jgi:hypothetical protein
MSLLAGRVVMVLVAPLLGVLVMWLRNVVARRIQELAHIVHGMGSVVGTYFDMIVEMPVGSSCWAVAAASAGACGFANIAIAG